MRIRRRRLRSSGAQPRKKDWFVLAQTECPQIMPQPVACASFNAPDLNTVFSAAFIDGQDLLSHTDAMTIHRQVGEITHLVGFLWEKPLGGDAKAGAFVVQVDEMIYLATGGDASQSGELDPRIDVNAESDQIMWRRRTCYTSFLERDSSVTVVTLAANNEPVSNAHLDIRVKRRVKQGEELIYSAGALSFPSVFLGTSPTIEWATSFNMRGFCKF